MRKKTEKEMKLFLQDAELNVRQARENFIDRSNVFLGAIDVLMHQKSITQETLDYLERQIKCLDTQSKNIEIEFYKLKQKIDQ